MDGMRFGGRSTTTSGASFPILTPTPLQFYPLRHGALQKRSAPWPQGLPRRKNARAPANRPGLLHNFWPQAA